MVEVCIFSGEDELYRAAWDTLEEARADLLTQLAPVLEAKFRQLKARGITMDGEYYFNKRGRVRKAIKDDPKGAELRELANILWQGEEDGLDWRLKPIE